MNNQESAEEALRDLFENDLDEEENKIPGPEPEVLRSRKKLKTDGGENQWEVHDNTYFPCGITRKALPSGNYWPGVTSNGAAFLQQRNIISDDIVEMPDSTSAKVLENMKKFWSSKQQYEKHGLLYKRGILLWGPPGSGKSVTVRQLSKQILDLGGIVVHCGDNLPLLEILLRSTRVIEPNRSIVVIFEDIDEIIARQGEHQILSLLDGEAQIANIVHIGTTNYPERLGARIVNRPSRFDDRIYVGMPSTEQRRHYLNHMAADCKELEKWIEDTEGLSIAHLRELVAAVYCLGAEYEPTLKRLRSMQERPKSVEGFAEKPMGFQFGGQSRSSRVKPALPSMFESMYGH